MQSTIRKVLTILSLACLPFDAGAQSASSPTYPVIIVNHDAGVLAIVDQIDGRLPYAFEKALEQVPQARTLLLNSPGGNVHAALAVASRVHGLGLETVIPDSSYCYSACAFIFLAGATREARGDLGVHQISSDSGDLVSGQFALADIVEILGSFDVPPEVLGLMLRTPPEDMYVFSNAEIARYGLAGEAPSGTDRLVTSADSYSAIDYQDPDTWRGQTITGALISDGRRWYSELRTDGTVIFDFTSGERKVGRYYVRDRSVCFIYPDVRGATCRTPTEENGRVLWRDDEGLAASYVVSVGSRPSTTPTAGDDRIQVVSDAIGTGRCALIVASRQTRDDARRYVLQHIADRRYVQGYLGRNGWIAISIGTLAVDEGADIVAKLKASRTIPDDSYCSTGRNYRSLIDLR